MRKIYSSTVLFFILLLISSSLSASHLAGGNITYSCQSGNIYTAKITIYRDCEGIDLDIPYITVSGCGDTYIGTYTGPTVTPVLITTPCNNGLTTCNGGSNPGIQRYDYLFTFILPVPLQTCNDVVFSYDINARNYAITTLDNPGVQNMYLEAHLNPYAAPCNTSPNFNVDPILFMCLNQNNCFNFGATEPNGDSLIYSFINPRQEFGATVDYNPGYDSTHAITGNQTIDPVTGDICMLPTSAGQVAVMAMKVTEKRLINGVWTVIGSVMRDIQMYMVACSNQLPTLTGVDSTSSFIKTGCAGSQVCFYVYSNDANANDSTKVSISSGPGTFTVTPGKRSYGYYCINTTLADSATTFSVILTVKDNACPQNGQQNYNYQIKLGSVDATVKDTSFCDESISNIDLSVTPTVPGTYTYQWTGPGGLSSSQQNPSVPLPSSSTTYTVVVTNLAGCSITKTMSVFILQKPDIGVNSPSICIGSTAQLNATGGTTYSWSPATGLSNPGISNPSANPTATTTYTVTVTDGNSCISSSSATVTVNPLPVVSATPATICIGATAQLTATGGATYSWSPATGLSNPAISNPSANPTVTTTYTVTVTDGNNCSNTTSVTVTVNPSLIVSATPATICIGATAQLTATGGTTYSWSPSTGLSNPGISNPSANPTATTTYTVTVTDGNNCSNTTSATVTVNPLPVVSATPATICIGASAQLTATGGTTYSWSPATGLSNPGISNPSANPTATTTYTVTVTDGNSCSNTTSATVTVNPLPVVSATPATICIGATAQLTATGGTTYSWSPATGLSNPGISNPSANPTATTTYTVTVTDGNSCSNTTSATVTVNPLPVVSATPATICIGATAQLTATGGTTYSWSPATGLSNPGISNPSANPTATTTYTVTVTDGNSCSNTTSATVTVNPLPIVSATPATICIGATAQLTATGGTTYSWSPATGLSNPGISNPSANPTATTTYTVTVTDGNSCSNTTSATVTVNPLPVVNATPATICIGATAQLTATGGTTYSWSPATGLNNPGISNPSANPTATTTYTVTVTDGNSCSNSTSATVTVNPLPIVSATPATICIGATAQLTATGGTAYSWSPSTGLSNPGIGNPSANPTATTTYTVTVTDGNSCSNTTSATVTVNPLPVVSATPATICIGATAQLTATGGTTYSWSPATGLSNPGISNPLANPTATTTYTVTVTDGNSCSNTTSATVTVNPYATVNVSPATICLGESVLLNASGGVTYTWSPASGLSATNIADPIANPSSTTTYSIVISDINGCTGNGNVVVTVNPLPVVSATPATICIGASAQLTATGGTTYSWSPATGLSNPGIGNPSANPTATTTYTVTVTDGNSCSNTTSATVTVNPLPVVSATPATICIGATAQLTATGGTTYSWSPATGLSNPGISNPSANPTATTTYTVTVTDGNSCSNTTSATVTVNPLPVVSATPATICIGATAQLTATGGTTYSWSPATGLSNPGISNPSANPTATTTYTVTVTDGNSCSNTTSATVTVNPLPVVNATPATICIGATAQLTATGGTTYSWSPATGLSNPGISNPSANPTATTTYTVTVTDGNSCSNTTSATVTVNPLPVVNATPATICIGATAQLTATGGTTYSWSPATGLSNPGISNPSANPTATTTYTVTVTDGNSCSNTTSATVTVNPLPVVNATPATICIGATAQLTATGGTTYSWSPATGLSNPGISNPSANPTATTTYTVTVTDGNSCSNTTSATVTVNPLPVVNATPATICIGATAQLTATGGTTYSWSPATGLSNPGISNPSANPTATTTYTVTVTDGNSCSNTTSATVTVNPLPVVSATPATICIGATAQLTATGGTTYSWSPATGLSNPGISNPSANPTATTTYTVTVTDGNSCSNTTSATVTVNPYATVNVSPATICLGESVLLNASGGVTYTWSPASGLSATNIADPIANPSSTTTYSIVISDINGCTGNGNVVVTVNPLPVVSATPATICIGATAQLTATGGTTYSWSPSTGLSNPGIGNPSANPTATTTYTVTVTDGNSCSNTTSATVTVNPLPIVSATPATICIGATAQLTATGGTTYSWSPATGLNNPGIGNPSANPTATTTYTVTVTDGNSCSNTTSATVTVNPYATVNVSPATICLGESVLLNASGGVTYTWSPASGLSATNIADPIANPSSTTTYSIVISDINGCTGNGNVVVTVNPLPVVSATPATICIGASAQLTATGGTTYSWSPATGLSNPGISNPSANPTATTTYTVTVTDGNSCSNTTSATVTVNPYATVNVSPATICLGESVLLNASGGVTYTWSPASGLSATNIADPIANPSSTTTYSIVISDINGCTGNGNVVVTVNPLPVVNATPATICIGATAQLTATGGTTYSWSPATGLSNPGISNPSANPTATTTYTVTVTDGNSCSNTTSATVTVNPLPVVSATPATICIGATAQLTATGGTTYSWSPATGLSNPGISNPSANPTATTTYTVTVTDGNSCSNTTSATVTVNPLPVVSATPATICIGATAQLTATGGTTYSWSPATGLSNPGISNPSANPTATTTYTVTVTDGNSCSNTTSATVTVNPYATVNVSPATICLGESVLLNASGGVTYTWSPASGLSATNIADPIANPSSTTTYSIVISDINGCTGNGNVVVTVNPLPVVSATPATICIGATAQLTATGGTTYSWSPATGLSNPGISNPSANPTATTTYTVTVTDSNSCSNTTSATVTVNPYATVNVSPATICLGESVLLNASGGVTYTWSPASGLSATNIADPIANPSSTTTYSIVISDINGCTGNGNVVVTVNPLPVVSATPATICIGASAQLTATGGTTYSWSPATGLSNPGISNPSANPTATTTYTVTVTDGNSCSNTTSATVTVNPYATVNVSPATICLGESVLLNASGGVTYTWSPASGLSATNIADPIANPSSTTTYSIVISDINGCTGNGNVVVTVNPLPVVSATPATICIGATAQLTATGGTTYSWSPSTGLSNPGIGNPSANPTATTTYTVTVTDGNSCSNTTSATVTVNPLPIVSATPATICIGATAQLTATGGTTYSWSPATGLSNPGIGNPSANPTATTTYTVTVTDANSCSNTTSATVTVNPLPVVKVSPNVAICKGKSTQLTSSSGGAVSYIWTPASSLSNPGIENPISSPSMTTIYTVEVIDTNGCHGKASVRVTVDSIQVYAKPDYYVCEEGGGVILSASGGTTYVWSPPDFLDNPNSPTPYADPPFTTTYTVIITEGLCIDSAYVTVHRIPIPPPPHITVDDDTLSVPKGFTSYQWYFNGSPISGETNYYLVINQVGNYSVYLTDSSGCKYFAPSVLIIDVSVFSQAGIGGNGIKIFPNPSGGKFTISFNHSMYEISLSIYNCIGQVVFKDEFQGVINKKNFDLSLAQGMYIVQVSVCPTVNCNERKLYSQKLIIQ